MFQAALCILEIDTINAINHASSQISKLLSRFQHLMTGLGKLKGGGN